MLLVSVWQAFLLLFFALFGTFFLLFSPSRVWSERKATMSPEEFELYKQEKNSYGLANGEAFVLLSFFEIFYCYAFEPVLVLWTLPFAPLLGSFALLIIIVRTLLLFWVLASKKSPPQKGTTTGYWIGKVILSLPTLYLWFVWLVVIGLVR